MRLSRLLCRTSRKGPGSWTEPILLHSRHRASEGSPRPMADTNPSTTTTTTAKQTGSVSRKGVSRSSPAAGTTADWVSKTPPSSSSTSSSTSPFPSPPRPSASLYDAGDNAYQYASSAGVGRGYGDADHPSRYNWKADPALNKLPPHVEYNQEAMQGKGSGSTPQSTKRVADSTPPIMDVLSGSGDGKRSSTSNKNWLGGDRGKPIPDTLERATMQHTFGAGEWSMVKRQNLTMTRVLQLMADATLKPRDADSRAFGGDGATKLAEQREELKTMDQRVVPFQHEDLLDDYLKNVDRLHTPSGAICEREVLKGRLVGLLFFTESERSLAFMRMLQPFHKKHSPDFVTVACSLAGKEMMDVTRSFGFFHCTHRDGSTWVARDAGLMVRPFTPMPRLLILNGTTGKEITRYGLTGVVAKPDTCFEAWRRGESGYEFRDLLKTIYL